MQSFVGLIVGIGGAWLIWHQLWGKSSALWTAAPPGGSGSGDSSSQGTGAAGPFSGLARLFGISGSFVGRGDTLPGVGSADQAGLSAMQGGRLQGDFDYAANFSDVVQLPHDPSGKGFTYLGNDQAWGKWGNILYFQTANGGVFGIPHILPYGNFVKGVKYPGGAPIGLVWSPFQDGRNQVTPFWTGYHFALITDTRAYSYLKGLAS